LIVVQRAVQLHLSSAATQWNELPGSRDARIGCPVSVLETANEIGKHSLTHFHSGHDRTQLVHNLRFVARRPGAARFYHGFGQEVAGIAQRSRPTLRGAPPSAARRTTIEAER
jgi:hypothetical protein